MVPWITNKYGFKKPYVFIGFGLVLTYSLLNLSNSLNLTLVLMALNGVFACRCAFGFAYASAFLPRSYLSLLSAIYMGNDGLTTLW
jgi:hypothetical protein